MINEYQTIDLLHDTLEDTQATEEELNHLFNPFIVHIVKELTNDNELKKKMGKANYLCLKMSKMSLDALNIKLCDRLANIYDLKSASEEF